MLFWVSTFAEKYLMVTFFHAIRLHQYHHQNWFFPPGSCPLWPDPAGLSIHNRSKSCTVSVLPYIIIPTLWHGAVPVVPEVPQWVIFSFIMCTLLLILCARNVLNKKHFSSSISCPKRKVDIMIISIKTDWTANRQAKPGHLIAIWRVPLPPILSHGSAMLHCLISLLFHVNFSHCTNCLDLDGIFCVTAGILRIQGQCSFLWGTSPLVSRGSAFGQLKSYSYLYTTHTL